MRNFSKSFGRFVAGNPNLSVFLVGFAVFIGGIAAFSAAIAGVCGGVILMGAAAFPYVTRRS